MPRSGDHQDWSNIMTDPSPGDLTGCPVIDAEGIVVGTVRQVYVSDATGQPGWVVVRADTDEGSDRFAPLAGSEVRDGYLVLGVPAPRVSQAPWPELDSEGHLSAAGAGMLFRHYGPAGTQASPADNDQNKAGGMTLSEERLRVRTEQVVSGRARLVKYVVTEEVTLTVLVSHEEVRVELEPANGPGDQSPATAGAELGPLAAGTEDDQGRWMILHAERPVVQMESVPVERVRLRIETVTEQQEVTGQVRKERIGTPEVEAPPVR